MYWRTRNRSTGNTDVKPFKLAEWLISCCCVSDFTAWFFRDRSSIGVTETSESVSCVLCFRFTFYQQLTLHTRSGVDGHVHVTIFTTRKQLPTGFTFKTTVLRSQVLEVVERQSLVAQASEQHIYIRKCMCMIVEY